MLIISQSVTIRYKKNNNRLFISLLVLLSNSGVSLSFPSLHPSIKAFPSFFSDPPSISPLRREERSTGTSSWSFLTFWYRFIWVLVDDRISRRKRNVLFLEGSEVSLCSSFSHIVHWSTFSQDHPDSIYMLNILCICRLNWVQFFTQNQIKFMFLRGRKSTSWWGTIAFLFPSYCLLYLPFYFLFFLETKGFFIHIFQGFFF